MVSTMHTLQVIQGPNQISRLELEQSNREVQTRYISQEDKKQKEKKKTKEDRLLTRQVGIDAEP